MRGANLIGLGLWLLLLVASGCSRKITSGVTTIVRDSLIVKEVPRIVEKFIPGQTVFVKEYIECDSTTNKPKPKNISASNGKAKVTVSVKADGTLTASGGCDSLKALIEVRDKEIEHIRSTNTTKDNIRYEHEPYWFDIAARWISSIVILAIAALLIYYKTFK
jgi:hypothetical protein